MKKILALSMLALICVAAGCSETTPGEKLDGAIDAGAKKADAVQDAIKK